MRVRTFDMLSDEKVEGELVGLTINSLATIDLDDGRRVVRHLVRCEFDRDELRRWIEEKVKRE